MKLVIGDILIAKDDVWMEGGYPEEQCLTKDREYEVVDISSSMFCIHSDIDKFHWWDKSNLDKYFRK
jgi:hypothetical protein